MWGTFTCDGWQVRLCYSWHSVAVTGVTMNSYRQPLTFFNSSHMNGIQVSVSSKAAPLHRPPAPADRASLPTLRSCVFSLCSSLLQTTSSHTCSWQRQQQEQTITAHQTERLATHSSYTALTCVNLVYSRPILATGGNKAICCHWKSRAILTALHKIQKKVNICFSHTHTGAQTATVSACFHHWD